MSVRRGGATWGRGAGGQWQGKSTGGGTHLRPVPFLLLAIGRSLVVAVAALVVVAYMAVVPQDSLGWVVSNLVG